MTSCAVCRSAIAHDQPSRRTLVGTVHETCPTDRYAEAIAEWSRAKRGLGTAARERPAGRKRGHTNRARDQLLAAERKLHELADELQRAAARGAGL